MFHSVFSPRIKSTRSTCNLRHSTNLF